MTQIGSGWDANGGTYPYSIYNPPYRTGDFPDLYKGPFPVVATRPPTIHLVYPRCYCEHCRAARDEEPNVPAMRPEDV